MRNAFADEITKLAAEDPSIVLLSGDIGNKLFNTFKEKFPDRFINCGVAEANMTTLAAGMASAGMKPITYTIASFNTFRCFEQIKVDMCYQNLPVVIVGVGAGLSYAELGGTHQSCEDIAFLRSLPNMNILNPGDPQEVRGALREALNAAGPVYLRMGKKGEPKIHDTMPTVALGKVNVVKTGSRMVLISSGTVLSVARDVAESLEKKGYSIELASMITVKPLDENYLRRCWDQFSVIGLVEEHSRMGGLASAVIEWAVEQGLDTRKFVSFGTKDEFYHEVVDQDEARKICGISTENIELKMLKKLDQFHK